MNSLDFTALLLIECAGVASPASRRPTSRTVCRGTPVPHRQKRMPTTNRALVPFHGCPRCQCKGDRASFPLWLGDASSAPRMQWVAPISGFFGGFHEIIYMSTASCELPKLLLQLVQEGGERRLTSRAIAQILVQYGLLRPLRTDKAKGKRLVR